MSNRIRVSLLLLLIAAFGASGACGFPRPQDVGDDADPGGCTRDEQCGGDIPACVDGICAACRVNDTCPASAPVCDATSRDCRSCMKDSECESGACDLAAGTCVGQGQILYASPGGGNADACTRSAPCSLAKAASDVDAAHPYIVLLPGTHTSLATLIEKRATLCGNGASLDGEIRFFQNSSVRMRDLKIFKRSAVNNKLGTTAAIECSNCEATLDNIEIVVTEPFFLAFRGGPKVTIRNSLFSRGLLTVHGAVVIDRSTFAFGATVDYSDSRTTGSLDISNSLFSSPDSQGGISINPNSPDAASRALISNNTFIRGTVTCSGSLTTKILSSNILNNTAGLAVVPGCFYTKNITFPRTEVGGTGNFSADPQFVDPANDDFHLRDGSPAIDAAEGAFASQNPRDRDGTLRPQGAGFDIGAFEYIP